jgi:hypothetical protein
VQGMIGHEIHEETCPRKEDEEGRTGMDWCTRSEMSAQAWGHRLGYG